MDERQQKIISTLDKIINTDNPETKLSYLLELIRLTFEEQRELLQAIKIVTDHPRLYSQGREALNKAAGALIIGNSNIIKSLDKILLKNYEVN